MASYTSSDPATRLEAVRKAIDDALAAQAYTQRGRSKTSAKLEALMKLEERLVQEVENSGRMASVGRYVRPR